MANRVTDIIVFPFNRPVTIRPGDTLSVYHSISGPGVQHYGDSLVCKQEADFNSTWTHSILFRVNGQVQWLLGNEETIKWLKGLEDETPPDFVLDIVPSVGKSCGPV